MNDGQSDDSRIGPQFVARRRAELVTVEVDGDAIVYDAERRMAHLLSSTGALIWELIDGGTRLDDLAAELAEAFGAAREQVLRDVIALTEELGRQGLLQGGEAELHVSAPVAGDSSSSDGQRATRSSG